MADLIYVAVIIVFFAFAALFVVACDHVIGPDDTTTDATTDPERVIA